MRAIDRERDKVKETRIKVRAIFTGAMARWKQEAEDLVFQVNKANALVSVPLNSMGLTQTEVDELLNTLAEMAKDGALESLTSLVGAGFEVDVEEAASYLAEQWARNYGGVMIKNIQETTRDGIAQIIADGLAEGSSSSSIANDLNASYTLSEERAETIARTETAYADVAGNVATYSEAGVEKKMWVLGSDSCDICVDNAAAGAIDFNATFPSGEFAPPAHPNCTCDIVPVLE